jgi:hypothetical protein
LLYEQGILYVNPKGKGARKIKPFLECVAYEPGHISGFDYIAYFGYTNDNSMNIRLDAGSEFNFITAVLGTYNDEELPDVFERGTHYFKVYFNGSKLTWTVVSFEVNQKAAVASEASSTSSRCGTDNVVVGTQRVSPTQLTEQTKEETSIVYPNPATSKVVLDVLNAEISPQNLQVFDLSGRSYGVKRIRKLSNHSLELDISTWSQGTYFIRARVGDHYRIFKVVKSRYRSE